MEYSEAEQPERRHEPRIEAVGSAVVHGELTALRARIVDIAIGGMLLQVADVEGLAAWRERAVAVDIRIDGRMGSRSTVIGRIGRIDLDTGRMAVHFDTVPTALQELLAAESLASTERDSQPHIILVHRAVGLRDEIARLFRKAGCRVVEVSSRVEALVQLGKSRYAPALIVMGDAMPDSLVEELRDSLSEPRASGGDDEALS